MGETLPVSHAKGHCASHISETGSLLENQLAIRVLSHRRIGVSFELPKLILKSWPGALGFHSVISGT
jgi:hypothetical protein